MTDWIVGDIHGCARELARLVERLKLTHRDRLISVGDLFHRGPDPDGVLAILESAGVEFILGNHEHTVLRRCGLAPRKSDASDRPPVRASFPPLESSDLAGDGGEPCSVAPARRADFLRFLQRHSGFWIEGPIASKSALTAERGSWVAVHAGVVQCELADNSIETLTTVRRLEGRGKPWWYERYEGSRLVLFGHSPSRFPRAHRVRGKLLALGLDTGCVYGGALTAYAPDIDEFVSVPAEREYARAA